MNKVLQILSLIVVLYSCTEPYDFEVTKTVRTFVVDASLTNEQKAHYARITYSSPIDNSEKTPVTGATVWIEDSAGKCIDMIENQAGYYLTDSLFAGEVGQTYTLYITTSEDQHFASTEEKLIDPSPINSIYGKYLALPSSENETFERGVQIFIDSHSDSEKRSTFRYEYTESFELPVPYPSAYDWSGKNETFKVWKREIPLGTCYRKFNSTNTILGTTQGLVQNRISEFPIRFINENEPHLTYKYIINVRQYSISNEAYTFYTALRETNESAGSFFDKQKGTLSGNIKAIGENVEPALGYFEVAGVSEKKRIFSQEEFAEDGLNLDKWICSPEDRLNFLFGIKVLYERDKIIWGRNSDTLAIVTEEYYDWIGLDTILNGYFTTLGMFVDGEKWRIIDIPYPGELVHPRGIAHLADKHCSDCTIYGLLDKPLVWDNED